MFHEPETFSKKSHKNFIAVVQDPAVGRVTDPRMCNSSGFSERFSQFSLYFAEGLCAIWLFFLPGGCVYSFLPVCIHFLCSLKENEVFAELSLLLGTSMYVCARVSIHKKPKSHISMDL